MRVQPELLYAVVDAGRSPEVLTLLYGFGPEMRSLYDGESEARLGPSGPYLVRLPSDGDVLPALLRKGWGQAWGVFVSTSAKFDALRKHFRSLLMVRRQSDAAELYFRFYDPRVLRAFLPTCDKQQLQAMFGPVSAYLVESQDSGFALRIVPGEEGVMVETIDVATPRRSVSHA